MVVNGQMQQASGGTADHAQPGIDASLLEQASPSSCISHLPAALLLFFCWRFHGDVGNIPSKKNGGVLDASRRTNPEELSGA